MTTEHHNAGTLRYLAPELMGGATEGRMTDKADMYSLGVLLWEMAAREVPWKGCSDTHIPLLVRRALATVSACNGHSRADGREARPLLGGLLHSAGPERAAAPPQARLGRARRERRRRHPWHQQHHGRRSV